MQNDLLEFMEVYGIENIHYEASSEEVCVIATKRIHDAEMSAALGVAVEEVDAEDDRQFFRRK
jgi:hypothetical protein